MRCPIGLVVVVSFMTEPYCGLMETLRLNAIRNAVPRFFVGADGTWVQFHRHGTANTLTCAIDVPNA